MSRAHRVHRALRALARLRVWPDTLFGRLVAILAAGMFAGQLLTSTIWFDTHDNRTLEIPARLFASRLADTVRLLERAPDAAARDAVVARLGDARYQLQWLAAAPPPAPGARPLAQHATGELIEGVIRKRLGEPIDVRLVEAQVRDDSGRHRGILSLFDSRMPTGDFHVQLRVPGQGWLDIRSNEGQAGMHTERGTLVLDYLLRIYLIRFVAICALALIAVRLALNPLHRFAVAAESLGRNIYRAPLPVGGPREVRRAARSFNAMQQQLIDSFAARTRFLSAVSHDLRSPLTRLRLRTEMLPDPAWRERLRGDLDDMEAMVRATLDAVQGIEITEARQRIDVDSMLEGLALDAREAGHRVSVEGTARLPVAGFPRNLKRCLQNLLDNAIRHGNEAAIGVHDDGRRVRIVIGDRGPGIADDALRERVFEPYFRLAPKADGAPGGTGLGLTIARSIAAAHGGTLVLTNRIEAGRIAGLDAELTLPRDD
ncbi:ATP-binding protein [Paraburkholderia caballeronis]|uniref:ATP-binding protein n=1 Tax=Paraburkholderia caballeronis TaxID=416943 RepID=UPI001065175C|nr:ATP-binding protein [Paraburkholderia caballeronis]TDV16369.1 signal transduction histidine kinase [Paraburkholderia caballeronis]TDV20719.1 signal transduction histidine kinase [Paraburkholderia caballeronis]TDV33187.1 signal transduction histidine kinase [Paraburkholderia caballeronis]